MPQYQVATVICPLPLLHHPKVLPSFATSFITPVTLEIQLQQVRV